MPRRRRRRGQGQRATLAVAQSPAGAADLPLKMPQNAELKLRYRGTPHTYNMSGVMIASVQHMWMMPVAVALLILSVTPAAPWEPDADSEPTRCAPPSCFKKAPRLPRPATSAPRPPHTPSGIDTLQRLPRPGSLRRIASPRIPENPASSTLHTAAARPQVVPMIPENPWVSRPPALDEHENTA